MNNSAFLKGYMDKSASKVTPADMEDAMDVLHLIFNKGKGHDEAWNIVKKVKADGTVTKIRPDANPIMKSKQTYNGEFRDGFTREDKKG